MKNSLYVKLHQMASSAGAIALAAASTQAIAQSHFTTVRAQIDVNEVPFVNVIETKTDPVFAEVGTVQDVYAKARASFGSNGAFATASNQPVNVGAYAESIWVDDFNIVGNIGTGILNISVLVSGTMDGGGKPGGPGSNSFYQLYASDSPISCNFDDLSCTGALLIPLAEGISGSRLLTGQLQFTYGETFYIASYLGAEVIGNGYSDFYGSAHFGATAPGGVSLLGGSGVNYAFASSVPEPTTAAFLFAGLALLGGLRVRKIGPSV